MWCQTQWILLFRKQMGRPALTVDQVLEEIVLHVLIGNLLLQPLVDGIVTQTRNTKDGKVELRILRCQKLLNFLIGGQFLMIIVRRKRQDGKSSIPVPFLELRQFRQGHFGLASLTRSIDHERDPSGVLPKGRERTVCILDRESVNGIRWQECHIAERGSPMIVVVLGTTAPHFG